MFVFRELHSFKLAFHHVDDYLLPRYQQSRRLTFDSQPQQTQIINILRVIRFYDNYNKDLNRRTVCVLYCFRYKTQWMQSPGLRLYCFTWSRRESPTRTWIKAPATTRRLHRKHERARAACTLFIWIISSSLKSGGITTIYASLKCGIWAILKRKKTTCPQPFYCSYLTSNTGTQVGGGFHIEQPDKQGLKLSNSSCSLEWMRD